MQLYLVRHAQSEANAAVPGAPLDCALTELGHRQAVAVGALLAAERIERVYASPYLRALETAEAISRATDAPCEVLPALHELHKKGFGEQSPFLSRRALARRFPKVVVPEAFTDDWWGGAPETDDAALARARAVLDRLVGLRAAGRSAGEGAPRHALVTHEVMLAKLLAAFWGTPDAPGLRVVVPNASVTLLEVGAYRWIHYVSRVDHLHGQVSR